LLLGFRDLSHDPTGWRSNDLVGCSPEYQLRQKNERF
jgi:hypothetical protein